MSIDDIIPELENVTGQTLKNHRLRSLGGGDINTAYQLQTPTISWFIKVNRPHMAHMFQAEAAGLKEMADFKTIRVPQVITSGKTARHSFLVLEYVEMTGFNSSSSQRFGEQLAAMHKHRQAFFGWHIDNTIGSTAQHNNHYDDWIDFWRDQRLLKQLQFAANNGYGGRLQNRGERLAEKVSDFFSTYHPQPSLLHGDLWGGNAAADDQGQPIIFDPACYYGDREADIAMTELFGGFGSTFYQAYQENYPMDSDYPVRKTLYNLYHIINHLNLFGGGYQHQAESMIDRLLAET